MEVVYEDNHIIIVSKRSGEIVQGDKTGDTPLSETVKAYLKTKYSPSAGQASQWAGGFRTHFQGFGTP